MPDRRPRMTSAINSVRRYMFLCYVYVLLGILYSSSRRVSIGLTLIPADASYSRKGLKPWHFVEFRFWHKAVRQGATALNTMKK